MPKDYDMILAGLSEISDMDKYATLIGGAFKGIGKGLGFGAKGAKKVLGYKHGIPAAGLALGGAAYGTFRLARGTPRPRRDNYTSHLRNNTLAGNINPNELNQNEMNSMSRLGMR